LLSVDYYSKWIEVAKLDDITSSNIICHLRSQFARYGIPDEKDERAVQTIENLLKKGQDPYKAL